ncbi:RING finger protein 121/175 [Pancytospora epiphaga]|nr:RING finger protein 121/175 [Pancytospora epiphaga]
MFPSSQRPITVDHGSEPNNASNNDLLNNSNDLQGDNGSSGIPTRVITRVIFLERPTTLSDIVPFIAVFLVYGLIVQMILSYWQKIHRKSHNIFQFIMVLIFPPLIMLYLSDHLFLLIWVVLLLFILYCLKKIIFTSMNSEMPREVFQTFKHIFFYTNLFIIAGQFSFAFSFIFCNSLLSKSLRLLFYSLYIAVLSREVIFNLSHVMAAKTGYFSKEGIPGVKESASSCMICTAGLSGSSQIVTLNCNHSFHEDCIRGWCLIGQNKFCPYCKKGVDNTFFTQELWEKTEMPFKPLMNFLRSFISFFIVVYCILMYKFRG